MISVVACCHGAKLCAHAAPDFRSQQSKGSGALSRHRPGVTNLFEIASHLLCTD